MLCLKLDAVRQPIEATVLRIVMPLLAILGTKDRYVELPYKVRLLISASPP